MCLNRIEKMSLGSIQNKSTGLSFDSKITRYYNNITQDPPWLLVVYGMGASKRPCVFEVFGVGGGGGVITFMSLACKVMRRGCHHMKHIAAFG